MKTHKYGRRYSLNDFFKEKKNRNYGNAPFHEPEVLPQSTTHMDLVTTWKVFSKTMYGTNINKSVLDLTKVESDASWTEFIYIKYNYSDNANRMFEEN